LANYLDTKSLKPFKKTVITILGRVLD